MQEYEVSIEHEPSTDSVYIKIRTFRKGKKLGFRVRMTEEWIEQKLFSIAEGETYPVVG